MTALCGDLLSLPAGLVRATVPLDATQAGGISLQGRHTRRHYPGTLSHLTQKGALPCSRAPHPHPPATMKSLSSLGPYTLGL